MTIGECVRKARTLAGLSQKGLARATGVTQASLSFIENNHNTPTLSVLRMISKACNVVFTIGTNPDNHTVYVNNVVSDIQKGGLKIRTDIGEYTLHACAIENISVENGTICLSIKSK